MRRNEASLVDIATFACNVIQLMEDIDQTTFKSDLRSQSAVLYQIAILGEAVKRLSQEFRQKHPEIEWKDIAGMRDKM